MFCLLYVYSLYVRRPSENGPADDVYLPTPDGIVYSSTRKVFRVFAVVMFIVVIYFERCESFKM